MNKKDRVLRAINFESSDRVPVVGGFVRNVAFLSKVAGSTEEQFWQSPQEMALLAFSKLGADLILGPLLPNPKSAIGAEIDHKTPSKEFQSPEDVRDHVLSLPSASKVKKSFNAELYRTEYLRMLKERQSACGDILWIANGIHKNCAVFDYCGHFGYENYLMALTLYPEEMEKLFAISGEEAFLFNQVVADVIKSHNLFPCVWTGSDACDNRGPYVAPSIMDQIYFPNLKHALEPLCEAGITIIWHADGNIVPILDSLIDVGIDGLQGLQEKTGTCIDVDELDKLRTHRGKRLIFMGSISSTVTMPFGTKEEVCDEVRRWQQFAKNRGGGVLLNTSSSLGPEVPHENIEAFFQTATRI